MQFTQGAVVGVAYFSTSLVRMRRSFQQILLPIWSGPTTCTCRAMKPVGSTSSMRFVQGMPLTQVRMCVPMHSTRAWFQPSL